MAISGTKEAESPRRPRRPRLKSIAELERELEMRNSARKAAAGNNGGARRRRLVDEVEEVEAKNSEEEREREGEESEKEVADEEDLEEECQVEDGEDDDDEEEDEERVERVKPIGSPIVSDETGESYIAFELDGKVYELEDAVMVTPDKYEEGLIPVPNAAIIKGIRRGRDGSMFTNLRWLYRPEELEMQDYQRWISPDPRELIYTDHNEEIMADNILYKCVVHFLPSHKELPDRRVHPGFVVQHFHDPIKKKTCKITDGGHFKGSMQKEIYLRIRDTQLCIGTGDPPKIGNRTDQKKVMNNETPQEGDRSTANDSEEDSSPRQRETEMSRQQQISPQQKMKTSSPGAKSAYMDILELYGMRTTVDYRDKCLEKLLEGVHSQWDSITTGQDDEINFKTSDYGSEVTKESMKSELEFWLSVKSQGIKLIWPDSVVGPLFSLEDETFTAFGSDVPKYKQKMRQLIFNLTNNALLAKRVVIQELSPSAILKMNPTELKDGFTIEELPVIEPDSKSEIEMADTSCRICSQKKVCILDVIQAGRRQRYQMECKGCGSRWFASRHDSSNADD